MKHKLYNSNSWDLHQLASSLPICSICSSIFQFWIIFFTSSVVHVSQTSKRRGSGQLPVLQADASEAIEVLEPLPVEKSPELWILFGLTKISGAAQLLGDLLRIPVILFFAAT